MSAGNLEDLGSIPDPLLGASAEVLPLERVEHALSTRKAPTRPAVQSRRRLALGASLIWVLGGLLAIGLRPDSGSLTTYYALAWLAAPVALSLVVLIAAVVSGETGLGVRTQIALGLVLGAPALCALAAVLLPPGRVVGQDPSFWKNAFVCFDLTLLSAAVPLGLAGAAFRHAFAVNARVRGALVGTASGLLALFAVNMHCPAVAAPHLLLGHVLPVVVATLLGAGLGYRFMRA